MSSDSYFNFSAWRRLFSINITNYDKSFSKSRTNSEKGLYDLFDCDINMNQEVELKGDFFKQANSLIFRGKPSHLIGQLTSPEKNIEIKVIAVSKQGSFKTKKG